MENLTWLGIGLVTAAYLAQRHAEQAAKAIPPVPPPHDNDVKRWTHDGTQPLFTQNGNRVPVFDHTVDGLMKDEPFDDMPTGWDEWVKL